MIPYPFSPEQLYCIIDYETFSEADLKKTGGFEYSVHPSTEVICVAWRVGTRQSLRRTPIQAWVPSRDGCEIRGPLMELGHALSRSDIIYVAHNAYFEQVITTNVLKVKYLRGLRPIPPSYWLCTAALAATLALPRKLADAGAAIGLKVQKDLEGHKLMLKYCKPRKPTKKNLATRHTNQKDILRITDYCITDIESETELFLRCPPLNERERRIWVLDQQINLRGVLVDVPLVSTALSMIQVESARLAKETEALTLGLIASPNQRQAVLDFVESHGVELPNLQKRTVEDALAGEELTGPARTMLEYRQVASKTSTAKYEAFARRSRHDGRVRDTLIYHQASTGRWAGAGVQLQNLPRGSIADSLTAAAVMADGNIEALRLLYGNPMDVFSSCLRNVLIASPGKTFDVADYAAIEARVLAWVAGDQNATQAFLEGRDQYKELATKIFMVPISEVTKDQRFVGKQAELGCGYGMGAKKFMGTCEQLGQTVSEDLARLAIDTYRRNHPAIVETWGNFQDAALSAIREPGTAFKTNRTGWVVKHNFLWCFLPSGRKLAYAYPSIGKRLPPWGGDKMVDVIFHYGVNSLSRKWEQQKTYGGALTENVVQALARDLMADAMLRIDATRRWELVLTVHDELVAERPDDGADEKEFCQLMATVPLWATGCPVKVEGWTGKRYKK